MKDMKELQFTITIVIKMWQKKEPLSLFRNHLNILSILIGILANPREKCKRQDVNFF